MNDTSKADLLYGVEAIADHLGMTERQARHRVEQGQIPSFKVGRSVCARRSSLDTWLAEQEAAARAPAPRP